eukprot:scaffold33386_cov60-Attheya_sp.AAC.3
MATHSSVVNPCFLVLWCGSCEGVGDAAGELVGCTTVVGFPVSSLLFKTFTFVSTGDPIRSDPSLVIFVIVFIIGFAFVGTTVSFQEKVVGRPSRLAFAGFKTRHSNTTPIMMAFLRVCTIRLLHIPSLIRRHNVMFDRAIWVDSNERGGTVGGSMG